MGKYFILYPIFNALGNINSCDEFLKVIRGA